MIEVNGRRALSKCSMWCVETACSLYLSVTLGAEGFVLLMNIVCVCVLNRRSVCVLTGNEVCGAVCVCVSRA